MENTNTIDKKVSCALCGKEWVSSQSAITRWQNENRQILCASCRKKIWTRNKQISDCAERNRLKTQRECYACGTKKTAIQIQQNGKYQRPIWFSNPPIGQLCNACYQSIFKKEYASQWWRSQKGKDFTKKRQQTEQRQHYEKTYSFMKRLKIFSILNQFSCQRCGESDWRCLQLEHKNGGGSYFRRKIGSNASMYSYYIANPDIAKRDLQVYCANCNLRKRYENGEHYKYIEQVKETLEAGDN